MPKIFIDEESLAELVGIFESLYPRSVVWAFGSRIDGSAHEGSDLDLAVVDFGQTNYDLGEIIETLKESSIPFLIDVFDFDSLPVSFQEEIRKEYVVVFDGRGGEMK